MTTKTDEQEREAFEVWASDKAETHKMPGGEYSSRITRFAWEAYQAGQAAIELGRQGRGEPVGSVEVKGGLVAIGVNVEQLGSGVHDLYNAPVVKESLTTAEPAMQQEMP